MGAILALVRISGGQTLGSSNAKNASTQEKEEYMGKKICAGEKNASTQVKINAFAEKI